MTIIYVTLSNSYGAYLPYGNFQPFQIRHFHPYDMISSKRQVPFTWLNAIHVVKLKLNFTYHWFLIFYLFHFQSLICVFSFLQVLFNPCYGSQPHIHYWYGPNSSMHKFHSCNLLHNVMSISILPCDQFQLMLMFP